jgi:hypothetical protein
MGKAEPKDKFVVNEAELRYMLIALTNLRDKILPATIDTFVCSNQANHIRACLINFLREESKKTHKNESVIQILEGLIEKLTVAFHLPRAPVYHICEKCGQRIVVEPETKE